MTAGPSQRAPRQRVAVVDRAGHEAVSAENRRCRPPLTLSARPALPPAKLSAMSGAGPERATAASQRLDRHIRRCGGRTAAHRSRERAPRIIGADSGRERPGRHRHADLEALADMAHVGLALDLDLARRRPREQRARLALHLGEQAVDVVPVEPPSRAT